MKKIQSIFLPTVVAGVASILTSGLACADTIFVTNSGNDTIAEITSGGTTTIFGSSADLSGPTGLAFNPLTGNLFVANNNSGDIAEFAPSGGTFTFVENFATGQSNPRGLAFDSAGNLYVSNQSTGTIEKFNSGGVGTLFASDLSSPNALAFDHSSGNLLVTNGTGNSITVITPAGIPSNLPITGSPLNSPNGIAFDSTGNIFVVNHNDPSIEKITSGDVGTIFANDSSLNLPKTLGFDSEGNLYVTDYGDNTLTEYNSAGVVINSFTTDLNGPCFVTALVVPEPSSYALLTVGAGLLFFLGRRKTAKV